MVPQGAGVLKVVHRLTESTSILGKRRLPSILFYATPGGRLHSTTFVRSQRAHKKRADKNLSAHRSLLMIMKIQCRADNVLQIGKDLISESVSSGLLLYNESLIACSHSDALSPRHHTFPFDEYVELKQLQRRGKVFCIYLLVCTHGMDNFCCSGFASATG